MLPRDLRSPHSKSPITFSKVLLVEGHDAFQFFKALLRHMSLLDKIELSNTGGISDLRDYLETLVVIEGFANIEALGIVRDAETSAESAFAALNRDLNNAGLPTPAKPFEPAEGKPQVSVFILPDNVQPGMLETLCLNSVSQEPAMLCTTQYFDCLKQAQQSLPNNMAKARLHAFLASRPKPDLLLGQAAHAGYWPFDHSAFDPLKKFLVAL